MRRTTPSPTRTRAWTLPLPTWIRRPWHISATPCSGSRTEHSGVASSTASRSNPNGSRPFRGRRIARNTRMSLRQNRRRGRLRFNLVETNSLRPTHCLAPARARRPVDAPLAPSRYARMFPELPSFSAGAFLFALGRAGGLCDCRTEEDDDGSLGSEAAGWPFFGQFIAHDITADRSTIRHHVDAAALTNARTPQLNLECLYGDGPIGHPFLFRRDDAAKLLLSPDAND